jgi:enoyl-CoA hydratase
LGSDRELVRSTRHDDVLLIEMLREEKRNAVDRALADALDEAFNLLEDDPTFRAGVLTGTTKVFSAGSDLTSGGDYDTERGGSYGLITRKKRKPLVAAVEGMALGGGMEMVLACDLVVASTTASFGLPEAARGLIPTCGGLFRAPRALPLNIAREMLLTGRSVAAKRLYDVGFVNVLCEAGQSVKAALEMAGQVSRCSPDSVAQSMIALEESVASDDEGAWLVTKKALAAVFESENALVGVRAFLGKEEPRWHTAT